MMTLNGQYILLFISSFSHLFILSDHSLINLLANSSCIYSLIHSCIHSLNLHLCIYALIHHAYNSFISISQNPVSDEMLEQYIQQKELNDLFNSFSYNYQVAYEGHNSAAEQIDSSVEKIGMVAQYTCIIYLKYII